MSIHFESFKAFESKCWFLSGQRNCGLKTKGMSLHIHIFNSLCNVFDFGFNNVRVLNLSLLIFKLDLMILIYKNLFISTSIIIFI